MNHIVALTRERARLSEEKDMCRREYEAKVRNIDSSIADIDKAISVINKAIDPYKCPHCGGKGSIRVPDAAGQMEDKTCSACHGTGIKIVTTS